MSIYYNDIMVNNWTPSGSVTGAVGATGYSNFQYDGSTVTIGTSASNVQLSGQYGIALTGEATQWEDLRFSAEAVRTQGSVGLPVWTQYGEKPLWFLSFTNNDFVYFMAQIPHAYAPGTALHPHVHIIPNSTSATGTIGFALQYVWSNIDGSFGDTQSVSGTISVSGQANQHLIIPLGAISGDALNTDDGADRRASSMLICALNRLDASLETPTSYNQRVYFLEVDFHYQVSRVGTYTEYPGDGEW